MSDTTVQAAWSVNANVLEAALHALELEDAMEQFRLAHERRLQPHSGRAIAAVPPESPLVDVRQQIVEMHFAGFFRAAASALDCLGIAIIGVLGLKTPLLKGDFAQAMRASLAPGSPPWLSRALQHVDRSVREAGPSGWNAWTLDMRNMYVHRPRRLVVTQAKPLPSAVLSPSLAPFLKTEYSFVLPRDPRRCDVDVLADEHEAERLVLAEECTATVRGVLQSVSCATEAVSRRLRRVWSCRLAAPNLIEQPATQWPETASTPGVGFDGYAPGSFDVRIDAFFASPKMDRRLRSAALLDPARELWRQNPFA